MRTKIAIWGLCAVFVSGFASGAEPEPPTKPLLSSIEILSNQLPYPQMSGVAEKSETNSNEYDFIFAPLPGFGEDTPTIRPEPPDGTCDSEEECKAKTDKLCKAAGHGKVMPGTVTVTQHVSDGGKTCSGECEKNGAVAFVTCDSTSKLVS